MLEGGHEAARDEPAESSAEKSEQLPFLGKSELHVLEKIQGKPVWRFRPQFPTISSTTTFSGYEDLWWAWLLGGNTEKKQPSIFGGLTCPPNGKQPLVSFILFFLRQKPGPSSPDQHSWDWTDFKVQKTLWGIKK